jgi:hypothetical protein
MNAMKISKIILFVFSFFILGFLSANAASVSGTVTVEVVGSGAGIVDCVGSWSSCLNGTQTYSIGTQAVGGKACPAVDGATQNCGPKTDCVGSYGACINGTQTYKITTPALNGGTFCSAVNGATQNCGPKTNCVGSWSSCVNGTETYNIKTQALNGGMDCPATDNETKACIGTCSAPLTKNVSLPCPVNANGDAAISGSVIQNETKSDFPGCIFETPVTNLNSVYVSDNCKYPAGPMSGVLDATSCTINLGESSCAVPYSWKVTNPESIGNSAVTESTGGRTLSTGDSGSKSLTLSYNQSTTLFLYNNEKELANKYVEAKLCSNCVWDSGAGVVITAGPAVDGYWSPWSSRSSKCPDTGTLTRYCVEPVNGGAPCAPDADGMKLTKDYSNSLCPTLDVWATFNGIKLTPGQKIIYNGKANVFWKSENVDENSCGCNYFDIKTGASGACGAANSPYSTPALKRDMKYTISCLGYYGEPVTDSVTIPVDKINADYIEQ